MRALARGSRVYVKRISAEDGSALMALNRVSRRFHAPWVAPPITAAAFRRYLTEARRPDHLGLGLWLRGEEALIGVINLSHIVRGAFQSAYLGYYIGVPYAGRGLMREGLSLLLGYAFHRVRLHRVEANIQPANTRSIALMRALGFCREGLARRYLKLAGRWRDHEHWVMLAEDWRRRESNTHAGR